VCGEGAKPVLCFDRGGWSPDLFAAIIAAGFGLLTYRKNQAGKDVPGLDDDAFAVMTWTGDDGRDRSYDLADGTIEVPVTSGTRKGETLTLRSPTPKPPASASSANALSKMTTGSTETSKPAPNNMAWLAKSRALSCLTKLCARDPSNQFRAAERALRPAGRDGGVSRRAAG
jgi:hypothetical protein